MNITKIRDNIKKFYNKKKQTSTTRNTKWDVYYQDRRWKRLREWYYEQHPICEICEMEGICTPTEEIHHLHIIRDGHTYEESINLCLDPHNLCSCCKRHHNMFHEYLRAHGLMQSTKEDILRYDIRQTSF